MAAYPARLAARPENGTGWHWLRSAVEMAALTSAHWRLAPVSAHLGWRAFPRVATRTPSLEPESVGAARDFTTATLRRWGVAERREDVSVVVSELLTNALRHGLPCAAQASPRWPIRLGLLHAGSCVLCAVADPSDKVPVPKDPSYLDETGRGLRVIASLSNEWGCTPPSRVGKVVWAIFATCAAG